ncbi:pilus assembly protein [Paraburkholderia sp. SARCC-3016]|uniref:TadE/TadG family type IV pilus assembly protein n=1 Tax=Paraburkholderia sp. SARCC-3016 TaxID=3058611 RepID=UPI0028095007|nr:pilus assembly protein [Paraburkholderia sp. SARCC-3016]MDQ7978480.1 pilus assembly protein [Paraburkholderia sp. SARCC-3016]
MNGCKVRPAPLRITQQEARSLRAQRGQAISEFIVIAPLLLFFCFAMVQFVLLYQAKATLDVATLEAVRAGAVSHGSMAAMQDGLARGLAPLHARRADGDGMQAALQRAKIDAARFSSITIVNPTREMSSDFARPRFYPAEGVSHVEIPNDTLMYRNPSPGMRSRVGIQDANLLKIRVHYCYDLYVPLVNKVLYYAVNVIGNVAPNGLFAREPADAEGDVFGAPRRPDTLCRIRLADGIATSRWPLALESEAIVRMQSPFRAEAAHDTDSLARPADAAAPVRMRR